MSIDWRPKNHFHLTISYSLRYDKKYVQRGDFMIYLDYAANTPVDKEVLDVLNDTTLKYYANSNSTHKLGRIVKKKMLY